MHKNNFNTLNKTNMPTTSQVEYWFYQSAIWVLKILTFHLLFALWNTSQLPLREAIEIRNEVAHPESTPSSFGRINWANALFGGTQTSK